jgi:hypothetical protein
MAAQTVDGIEIVFLALGLFAEGSINSPCTRSNSVIAGHRRCRRRDYCLWLSM